MTKKGRYLKMSKEGRKQDEAEFYREVIKKMLGLIQNEKNLKRIYRFASYILVKKEE